MRERRQGVAYHPLFGRFIGDRWDVEEEVKFDQPHRERLAKRCLQDGTELRLKIIT